MPVTGQKDLTAGRLAADDHLVDPRLHGRRTGQFIVSHRRLAVGKSTVVPVRLPDMMLAKLEDVAAQTGRTRNEPGADVH